MIVQEARGARKSRPMEERNSNFLERWKESDAERIISR